MIGLIERLQRYRWAVGVALLGLVIWAALGLRHIGVDNAVEVWFPEDDPELQAYHQFLETFKNNAKP